MINPLIISRNENAGLFRKICTEIGATQRELIGNDWSLALFLKRDLKNYNYQSHYIFDVSACLEKDDDFVSIIEGITYQVDKSKIVIYTDGHYADDDFLNNLVKIGITNIVANYSNLKDKDNFAAMSEDLKECMTTGLPKEKWRRYDKSFDAFAQAREAAELAEKEKAKPRYSQSSVHVAVVGSQSRIGATTFALRLAEYFRSREAESIVICASQRGVPQLEMMKEMYEGKEESGIITIGEGIDVCSSDVSEPQKKYNVEIYDFGNTPTNKIGFDDFDKVYLVGGTSWNELPMTYAAQVPMNGTNYTVAVNFSSESEIEKYNEALTINLSKVICLPFEANPFTIGSYEEIFDTEFCEWADRTANESDEEIAEENEAS